jgi:signal transduction histidine kinase
VIALRSRLSVKLGLVLFAIVAGALGIVYLAVVPRLESRLVDAKLRELEGAAPSIVRSVESANPFRYPTVASFFQSSLNARVVIFDRLRSEALIVLADSSGIRPGTVARDPIALEAERTGRRASGRVTRADRELAEVAIPVTVSTGVHIVLLSASLQDALANVRLVQRSLLLAGLVALGVSLLAGAVAAWRFSRRIRRLEEAAERIAGGDFAAPVVDSGTDEVGQLAQAFDAMRERLAQLDHARREFIANASHELRTPLFSLGGFLELLADEDMDEGVRREFLQEMRAQVERLTKLATDLLDLSRLDAGQLAVESTEVDLAAAARTLAEEFRVVAEVTDHDLRVAAESAVVAVGDEQRVLQVGRALVENALRHTPPGTAVEIRVAERDGRALLAVRDEGPGVGPEAREHLFERFYRGDGERASGSGLGLAISTELAKRMNGEIVLRSEPGETVFTLLLALSKTDISHENAATADNEAEAAAR